MLEVKGKVYPCHILMDPVLFLILEVPGHISKIELSSLVIGNFEAGFQAVFRNPSSFKPKDFIGEVRSDLSLGYAVRKNGFKPVAIEATMFFL